MMTRKIFGIVLAGGEGKRLMPLTEDRAKPAVPFGGQYRLIDFALSNLHQLGAAADRRADAVQVAQPRPPRLADLAPVRTAELVRRVGAGAAAARQAVVHRIGRRDPAEPQPDPRREARHRRRRRRRPRVPHGLRADDRGAHRLRGRGDRRRDPPADRARRPVRRDRGRPRAARTASAVPREAHRPRRPPRLPRRGARLDGQLRLRRRRAHRRRAARRRAHRLEPRHGRRHHPRLRGARARPAVYDLKQQRRARLDRSRPLLLARRGNDRLVLRGAPGPHLGAARSSTSTTASGRSSASS